MIRHENTLCQIFVLLLVLTDLLLSVRISLHGKHITNTSIIKEVFLINNVPTPFIVFVSLFDLLIYLQTPKLWKPKEKKKI